MTLVARPDTVLVASAGGVATSGGAGGLAGAGVCGAAAAINAFTSGPDGAPAVDEADAAAGAAGAAAADGADGAGGAVASVDWPLPNSAFIATSNVGPYARRSCSASTTSRSSGMGLRSACR